ncbi:MAG: CBS domain-containing protein [Clostridia bacterium]|nr:CBS domain-containing protein [Clostridia bacterium]
MNIALLLSPKVNTSYLYYDSTVRQGIEKFKAHGFTAVPVLDDGGFYVGTVSEGDFLRYILSVGELSFKGMETVRIRDIMVRDKNPPLGIDACIDELTQRLFNCNFVPITDARGVYIGIVTRKSLLVHLGEKKA